MSVPLLAATKNYRYRLSWIEVAALCVVVVLVTVKTMRVVDADHLYYSEPALPELDRFRGYGATHASQFHEEWFIRDFFQDKRGGVFLDVGANHYKRDSSTYFLETSSAGPASRSSRRRIRAGLRQTSAAHSVHPDVRVGCLGCPREVLRAE